mgnify:CR=1
MPDSVPGALRQGGSGVGVQSSVYGDASESSGQSLTMRQVAGCVPGEGWPSAEPFLGSHEPGQHKVRVLHQHEADSAVGAMLHERDPRSS